MLTAVQRPISPACITVRVPRPLWKDRPAWFLVAEQDRMIVQDNISEFMAERMRARVRSHAVDHAPLVTAPSLVLDVIREAIDQAVNELTFCNRRNHANLDRRSGPARHSSDYSPVEQPRREGEIL